MHEQETVIVNNPHTIILALPTLFLAQVDIRQQIQNQHLQQDCKLLHKQYFHNIHQHKTLLKMNIIKYPFLNRISINQPTIILITIDKMQHILDRNNLLITGSNQLLNYQLRIYVHDRYYQLVNLKQMLMMIIHHHLNDLSMYTVNQIHGLLLYLLNLIMVLYNGRKCKQIQVQMLVE